MLSEECFVCITVYINMYMYTSSIHNECGQEKCLVLDLQITKGHLDLRKTIITLVWNDQQSFYLHNFHIIILLVLFCVCEISIHCFIIELQ